MGDGIELRARVEGGALQVARYEGGRQTEEWREPIGAVEIASLLPSFTKNALADALAGGSEDREMLAGISNIVEKVMAHDAKKSARTAFVQGAPFDEEFGAPAGDDYAALRDNGGEDIFGRPDAKVRVGFPSRRAFEFVGAQFIPHLRVGGLVVAPDRLDDFGERQLVLRFNHNTYLPEVAECGGKQPPTEWRQPTTSEAKLFGDITPLTSAKGMVALYRIDEDPARPPTDRGARFVGFTVANEVVDVGGMRERVPAGFFDTLCDEQELLGSAGGVLLNGDPSKGGPFCVARLFLGKNLGNPARTNMFTAGCFGADQTMVFRRIVAEVRLAPGFIGEARKAALAAVRSGLSPSLIIGCKPFAPASCTPLEGIEDNGARYEYPIGGEVGIACPARQNFAVDVHISKAAYEILSIQGTRVRFWTEGTLCRDVQ